jgi:hypothetical protein
MGWTTRVEFPAGAIMSYFYRKHETKAQQTARVRPPFLCMFHFRNYLRNFDEFGVILKWILEK